MKDLTCSVYTFENLITGNFLYIDKTEYIYKLIQPANAMYFLSRPRRFGKSLTLSTLKAVFQGKKELFNGLAISKKDYDWQEYPVVHLDMGNCDAKNAEDLTSYLNNKLQNIAADYCVELIGDTLSIKFENLIKNLAKNEKKVVILVDEYDKPILSNIKSQQIQDILQVLKGFYSGIKGAESHERFVFITGVSKFAHVSIFSDLNNLTDISMHSDYATMLGYTQDEFEQYFNSRIQEIATNKDIPIDELKKEIRRWYNGFLFHVEAKTVYNPASMAMFFYNKGEFKNYWFSTGTPTFLLELMKDTQFDYTNEISKPVSELFFNSFDIEKLDPKVLLYQTGYLTIDKRCESVIPYSTLSITEYTLKFPNFEVESAFNQQLLEYYTNLQTATSLSLIKELVTSIGSGNVDGFIKQMRILLANIPYWLHVKHEHYYQTIFSLICDMLKMAIEVESCTNDGRIDMVLHAGDWIYVIEFKLNKSSEEALKQIENKDYALKYQNRNKKIMLIGVNFDFEKGQIADYIAERL